MSALDELALIIANTEWEFQGVHGTFRVEPAQRHYAIAEAVLKHLGKDA